MCVCVCVCLCVCVCVYFANVCVSVLAWKCICISVFVCVFEHECTQIGFLILLCATAQGHVKNDRILVWKMRCIMFSHLGFWKHKCSHDALEHRFDFRD